MKVRYPRIDFDGVFPHWSPHLEFAQLTNAGSVTPCYLEPYMIQSFTQARKLLDPVKDAQLIREVDLFIAQEAQHYRQHARFNKCFQTGRYPRLAAMEAAFKNELDSFSRSKPLHFNLAYAEGFESKGAVYYRIWFEEFDRYREGAKEEALRLWDWHNGEEFEHREVAYKLFMAIAARGSLWRRIWYGYVYRIYGVWKASTHIHAYVKQFYAHFMEIDRADMTEDERAASLRRQKEMGDHIGGLMKQRMRAVFSPFYDPAKKPPPRGLDAMMAQFDPGGKYGKPLEAG